MFVFYFHPIRTSHLPALSSRTSPCAIMGESSPADQHNSASHSRNTSHDRPSLNIRQPDHDSEAHSPAKRAPKSVLKKRSADEHTALLASQREQYGDPLNRGVDDEDTDYFGDEEDWQESKSTWYMILLTLAIGG